MAGVVITMSADEAKLWRAQQRLIQQSGEMAKTYGQVRREAQKAGAEATKAGKASGDAFGGQSLRGLQNFATGVVSLRGGLALVKKLLGEISAISSEAAGRTRGLYGGAADLASLPVSPRQLEQMNREVFSAGESIAVPMEELFALRTKAASELGVESRGAFIQTAKAAQFIGSEAAGAAGLKGSRLLGVTPAQSIAMTMAAAAPTDFTPKDLGGEIPKLAAMRQQSNADAAELMAAFANLTREMTPDEASTKINAILNKMTFSIAGKDSVRGKGLMPAIERLMSMSEEDRSKIIGNDQQSQGTVSTLHRLREEIAKTRSEMRGQMAIAGTDFGPVAQQGRLHRSGSVQSLRMMEIIQENRTTSQGIDEGAQRILVEQQMRRSEEEELRRGGAAGAFRGAVKRITHQAASGLGLDSFFVGDTAERQNTADRQAEAAAFRLAQEKATRALEELAEASERAAKSRSPLPPPAARVKQQQAAGVE